MKGINSKINLVHFRNLTVKNLRVFQNIQALPKDSLAHSTFLHSVQFSSVAQSCPTLCNSMDCSMPDFLVHHQLLEPSQTHSHRIGDAIQPSHPLPSPSPPTFNLSQHQGLFQWVSSCIRWPKYWSFSFSKSPSNEYSGLISFRMDWLHLLAVQGTLKTPPTTTVQTHQFFGLSFLYSPTLISIHSWWIIHFHPGLFLSCQ